MKKILFFILFSANLWAQEDIEIRHKQETLTKDLEQPKSYRNGVAIYDLLGKAVVITTEIKSEWYLATGVYIIDFYDEYEKKSKKIIVDGELGTTEVIYKEYKVIIREKI